MTKSRRSAATGMTIESFIARSLRDGASYLNSMMRMQPAEPAPPAVAVDDVDPEPEPPAPQPPPAAPAAWRGAGSCPPPAHAPAPHSIMIASVPALGVYVVVPLARTTTLDAVPAGVWNVGAFPAPFEVSTWPDVPATELRTPVPLLSTTPGPRGVSVIAPAETV